MVRGLLKNQRRISMTLITRFDLAPLSTAELHALWTSVWDRLARAKAGSQEQRELTASLQNIAAALRDRRPGPKPGPRP
jgi:hypothetical protein